MSVSDAKVTSEEPLVRLNPHLSTMPSEIHLLHPKTLIRTTTTITTKPQHDLTHQPLP